MQKKRESGILDDAASFSKIKIADIDIKSGTAKGIEIDHGGDEIKERETMAAVMAEVKQTLLSLSSSEILRLTLSLPERA